jgi:hypothetical protein
LRKFWIFIFISKIEIHPRSLVLDWFIRISTNNCPIAIMSFKIVSLEAVIVFSKREST